MSKRHEMLHAQLLISGVERYCYPPIQTFNGRCLIIHYHQMLQSVAHGICRNSINILTAIGISHFVAITASLKYYQTNHTLSISWGKSLRPPPSTVCRDSRLARCKPEGIGRATRRKEVPVCRDIYKYPPLFGLIIYYHYCRCVKSIRAGGEEEVAHSHLVVVGFDGMGEQSLTPPYWQDLLFV